MDWPASDSKRRRLRCMRAERSFAPRKLSQMPACINVRANWLSASREGLGNRQAPACVYAGTMDVRSVEHPEPTHIHVPRPSRAIAESPQLPVEYLTMADGAGDFADLDTCLIGCGDVSAAE